MFYRQKQPRSARNRKVILRDGRRVCLDIGTTSDKNYNHEIENRLKFTFEFKLSFLQRFGW
jgi:hypothetical protein